MPVFNNITNLCYLLNNQGEVLLQYKRRGFGQGKWNGPGGKSNPGESSEQSAKRETKEEAGVEIEKLEKRGELEFIFDGREDWNQITHVYVTNKFKGEIKASDEGELKWFKIEELPFKEMWEDDPYWLLNVLAGEYIKMRFYFDSGGKMLSYEKI
jgi:8-oxo-dGTP diphosphatase